MVGSESDNLPRRRVPWREIWLAWALSVFGTALLGGVLFALWQNVWGIALGGVASLVVGAAYVSLRAGESEPVYGALLAILYFGLVVGVLFGGELMEMLPDPLPGLGIGDSTFFFVWPLLQLAAAVIGIALGGRWRRSDG